MAEVIRYFAVGDGYFAAPFNSQELADAYSPPEGAAELPTPPAITGYQWQDGAWAAIPSPVPSTDPNDYPLQRYQFLAMLTIGNLASLVEPAVASITDPVQKAVAQAKFDATQVFQRDDPMLVMLATAAGLTSAQVDAYWMQAKGL